MLKFVVVGLLMASSLVSAHSERWSHWNGYYHHHRPLWNEHYRYRSLWNEPRRHRTLSFALIADAPYGDENVRSLDNLVTDVNRDRSVKFVMHGGDIKSEDTECSNERFQARFDQYQMFKKPFIYTPGDNEWAGCHQLNNGQYNPIERLEHLRGLFYPDPERTTGGRKMRVKTQSNDQGFEQFVENRLFRRSGVVFSSIHVVGSNNNLRPWSGIDENDSFEDPREDRLDEFLKREQASIAWLQKTFALAKKKKSRGVFILIHGDPQFETQQNEEGRAGFNGFLDELFTQAKAFRKPVVLAHGDSHAFSIDKPTLVPWGVDGNKLSTNNEQQLVPNLTRLQTFGGTTQHWVKVTVDPRSESLFLVEPQVVEENL